MKFEIEVITEEVLPAIRSMIATQLKKEYGLKQSEIAEKLGVTQPAVSQYLSNARADQTIIEKLKSDPQTEILVKDAGAKAARDEIFSEEIADIVKNVRDKGLLKEEFEDTYKII